MIFAFGYGSFFMDLVLVMLLQLACSLHNLGYNTRKICNREVVMTKLQAKSLMMDKMVS